MEWDAIHERVGKLWLPKTNPHHSIISQTGGGKTYLIRHGILSHIEDENVLFIDVKGDDPTADNLGKVVTSVPRKFWRNFKKSISHPRPMESWYRLLVHEDWNDAREQVKKALSDCYKEGNWTIVLDETRCLTDPKPPNLGLGPFVEQLWLRGRSRGICVVAATQGPRWVPKSFYEQAQFHWIGVVEDEDSQKRLREIGGMERNHLHTIKHLEQHHFVYTDRLDEDGIRFRAVTKVDR